MQAAILSRAPTSKDARPLSPEEFRRYGHRLIDWLADYQESLSDRPVMAKTRPGEVRDALPATPPDEPEEFGAVIEDLDVPGDDADTEARYIEAVASTAGGALRVASPLCR